VIYISDCCNAPPVEGTLGEMASYTNEAEVVIWGRCSSCKDQTLFDVQEEE
jgi:hypothetical protein